MDIDICRLYIYIMMRWFYIALLYSYCVETKPNIPNKIRRLRFRIPDLYKNDVVNLPGDGSDHRYPLHSENGEERTMQNNFTDHLISDGANGNTTFYASIARKFKLWGLLRTLENPSISDSDKMRRIQDNYDYFCESSKYVTNLAGGGLDNPFGFR